MAGRKRIYPLEMEKRAIVLKKRNPNWTISKLSWKLQKEFNQKASTTTLLVWLQRAGIKGRGRSWAKKEVFWCDCGKKFGTQRKLNTHLKKHKEIEKKIVIYLPKEILRYLKSNPNSTPYQMAKDMNVNEDRIVDVCDKLKIDGRIEGHDFHGYTRLARKTRRSKIGGSE